MNKCSTGWILSLILWSSISFAQVTGPSPTPSPSPSTQSCSTQCRSCTTQEGCSQKCERVGDCQNCQCKSIALCVEGYHWDDVRCDCVLTSVSPSPRLSSSPSPRPSRSPTPLPTQVPPTLPPSIPPSVPPSIPPGTPPYTEPTGSSCGQNQCGPGEYCCNQSCGICAPVGGFCIQSVCLR
jgi:hypothetical protein